MREHSEGEHSERAGQRGGGDSNEVKAKGEGQRGGNSEIKREMNI